jgi:hypothetical protein
MLPRWWTSCSEEISFVPRPESLVRRAWRLTAFEKLLAVEAAVALTAACAIVRCSPGPLIGSILRGRPTGRRPARAVNVNASSIAVAIARVAPHHPFRPQCLEQALASRWMLARRGQPSRLVIGARQHAFEAHAWLEVNGRVLREAAHAGRYEPIWRSER